MYEHPWKLILILINIQVLEYLLSSLTPGRTMMTVNHSGNDIIQGRSNIPSDGPQREMFQ